ncbi:hypothetical protein CHLRE_01g012800v5 [Chlamydomonas reinhardtii]|uniref:Uncharacterized protein n=1 Tax=Chlamydomonas reinhardtii TaxID=3055 RepID=A8HPD5_CHLRE|nr:uncharacterized protein CHLRE_01g012800v5 [Chlamydomonas reinhardtii]XP_042928252.1 uncharacterized protein CHLRE_01g012800v5 [Chlamydomonas reinhardtii]PNW88067.1 hypothetical protein CHLRE_01g012800v5 [Chlamydomonas reinhardtii]PNW88068.1 hypothetical protein CHLRE_01g012800v5 [Chlamydomonas reinhardtii]|eukprot:XP_001689442.1 flagellar associated protein [Chlamydomonas reinhardtii]
MSKSVHVMLLAGGYSADIARGAASVVAAAQPPAGTPRSARITPRPVGAALSAAASAPAAVPALIPLDGTPALVRTLQLLKDVRRVRLEAVWIVHNESDTDRIKGPSGIFAAAPETELGLPAINFISNGATGPGDWRGEVADLRVGLKALAGRGSAACVAVISSELAFMPAYNLQRLLEHAYLRGRDTLGFSFLNGVDVSLLGTEGHTVFVPGEDTALPRVQQLVPHSAAGSGMCVAEPFLLLRPESAGAVAGGAGGAVGTLPELAAAVMAGGGYVAGIDLMFGRYNLRTAQAVDYADRFFAFCSAAALDPKSMGLPVDTVLQPQTVTAAAASSQGAAAFEPPAAGAVVPRSVAATFRFDELEGGGAGTTGRMAGGTGGGGSSDPYSGGSSLRGTDYEAFVRTAGAFNSRFFGDASSSKAAAAGLKQYLLPPTFYMTAYRRQAADIML